ncbi:MAG: hypothetical protein HYS25_08925 [Ignavibacteriales bacterium]|nr:hypothetical protein [Ignavibacteriales bacterium]
MTNHTAANKNLPEYVKKYLNKYGINNTPVNIALSSKFDNIIVVPAIAEHENILNLLSSLSLNDKKYFDSTLLLFVINNLKNSADEVKKENRRTMDLLKRTICGDAENEREKKIQAGGLNIGFIDAASEKFVLPEKEGGVGLARKIGMDTALTLFDYSNSKKKILICLDADCTVDENYLASIIDMFNQSNISAAYVKYEHALPKNENEKAAIICYEIFLRYYVLGLKYAGSPYAFPTIGSTMICDAESYCKIGGMNKRKAAEDFYFMEKLAKITSINEIKNTTVHPSSRGSWRVPFGTGQRVNRFLSKNRNEYLLYDPESFVILKKWNGFFLKEKIETADYYLERAGEIHPSLKIFLEGNLFAEQWKKILEGSKSSAQIQKQKILWFDGFRTLKLIHFLRDSSFPEKNMFDALDEIFKVTKYELRSTRTEMIPNFERQMEYLEALKSLA